MNEKEQEWITEIPDPPPEVLRDVSKLLQWNAYWEAIIRQYEDEREQERRSRRTM